MDRHDGFLEAKIGEEYLKEEWLPSMMYGFGIWHVKTRRLKLREKAGVFGWAYKDLETERRLFVVADLAKLVPELVEKGVMKEIDLEEVT